jgi:phage repressor protein C with HTH and peptisase S24 domain
VRLEWLASGREPMLTKTPLQMAFGREQIVLVPVFEVVAAAVHPAFDWMPEGDPIARVALPLEAVRVQMNSTPEALVAIPVVGRSMEPMYREGELALIDRTCTEVPPAGGHYLLRTPDGLRIKHVKLECGHLVLSSVNAAEFPPERLGAAEALVIQVLGRVAGTQPDPRCARIDPAP